ncbi:unnamed protein product [Adineta steineri]|uniref:Uncharacterized protein n=1 Tax=Adineta steineri TaxID=433720 RepID=A0A819QQZ5_9BILA|nr:unnamed protein product [Adineta steineri]CAF4004239.1 unnamed protein product [Adineta steineri]CAF4028220.1 unnamed protein product [Adineta steineri]
MDTFDYPVIIKQESLSLPTSSPFIYKILNTNDSIMPIVPNIKVESEDLMEIARQKKFNLIIPSEHEEPNKKFRLVRKAFAIVCRSNMTKDDIMQHIHREFNLLVQYICISSPNELPTCSSSRMQCNYLVTNYARAWNSFLKKAGHYIEFGKFRFVPSRACIKSSKKIRYKHKQTGTTYSIQNQHSQMPKRSLIAEQIAQDIMLNVRTSIENAMELANTQISTESQYERNA